MIEVVAAASCRASCSYCHGLLRLRHSTAGVVGQRTAAAFCKATATRSRRGCTRLFMRREGSPMLISLSLVMRKACFRVRLRAIPRPCGGPGGGATYQWRLNEKTRDGLSRKRQAKLRPQISGRAPLAQRSVAFVRSPSRKTVSSCSRRGRAPANTHQGPERPRKAFTQAVSYTHLTLPTKA